jgi:hypothetical protein
LARPTCSRCALRNIACEYASPVVEQSEQPASPGIASAGLGLDLDTMPSFQASGLSSTFDSSLFEPFFDLQPWSPQLISELVMQPQPSIEGRELLPFNDSYYTGRPVPAGRSGGQHQKTSILRGGGVEGVPRQIRPAGVSPNPRPPSRPADTAAEPR